MKYIQKTIVTNLKYLPKTKKIYNLTITKKYTNKLKITQYNKKFRLLSEKIKIKY